MTYTSMPEGDDEAKCRKWMTGLPASLSSSCQKSKYCYLRRSMHLSIGISCRNDRKAEIFSFENDAVPRTKKFRQSVIYALHHRDFMQTSRRPPRSAIFGPKACGFHGNGHLSPRDRNVDVFDEHRESTNGSISVPL